MTMNEFTMECIKRTIDPAIALDNATVRDALRSRDYQRVCDTLDAEF